MTGTSCNRRVPAGAFIVFACLIGACVVPKLAVDDGLTAAARWKGTASLRAAAWLLGSGHIRINIEPDPDIDGSCGLSLFIKEADPEHGRLEIRCPDLSGKGLPGETGAMGSLFEKTATSIAAWTCSFTALSVDFSAGDETENSGCFVAETAGKKLLKGCFVTTGLFVAETSKRLKPITK